MPLLGASLRLAVAWKLVAGLVDWLDVAAAVSKPLWDPVVGGFGAPGFRLSFLVGVG